MFIRLPQQARVSDPPTDDQQRQLDLNIFTSDALILLHSSNLEYDYVNTWHGQRWLSLAGKTTGELTIHGETGKDIRPFYG